MLQPHSGQRFQNELDRYIRKSQREIKVIFILTIAGIVASFCFGFWVAYNMYAPEFN